MDETGFQIGVGKSQLCIRKRKHTKLFTMRTNRETATAVETISAAGEVVPAFLILKGMLYQSSWYQVQEMRPQAIIGLSESGYTNDELSLSWLKHFERHTRGKTRGSKRLLLLDGYGSHHTLEFLEFCSKNSIIPFGLPAHTTHLLQPLDVVVFQPYKHYHAKALDLLVREGIEEITKLEFLSVIEDIRSKTFKSATIISSFKRTGIYPLNASVVLSKISQRHQQALRALPSSPTHTPEPLSSPPTISTPVRPKDVISTGTHLTEAFDSGNKRAYIYLERFVRGALTVAWRGALAERDQKKRLERQRRNADARKEKRRFLQRGGVLSVEDAREKVLRKQWVELLPSLRKHARSLNSKWKRAKKLQDQIQDTIVVKGGYIVEK